MKHLYIVFIILVTIISCKKDKPIYKSFNERELDFVSYLKGQTLKFIDTNNETHVLQQSHFLREYDKFFSMFGKTNDFQEKYEFGFESQKSPQSVYLALFLYGEFYPYTPGELVIDFCKYKTGSTRSPLTSKVNNMTINNINYSNVYLLKAYKDGIVVNNSDTATVYWNKQFGLIQLLFPSGKSFNRID